MTGREAVAHRPQVEGHAPGAVGACCEALGRDPRQRVADVARDAVAVDVADAREDVEVRRARPHVQLDARRRRSPRRPAPAARSCRSGRRRAPRAARCRRPGGARAAAARRATASGRPGRSGSRRGRPRRAARSCRRPPAASHRRRSPVPGGGQLSSARQPSPTRSPVTKIRTGSGRDEPVVAEQVLAQPAERLAHPGSDEPRRRVRPRPDDELRRAARRVQRGEVLEHPGQEDVVPAADELHGRRDLRDVLRRSRARAQ